VGAFVGTSAADGFALVEGAGDTILGLVLDAIVGVELDVADGFVLVEGAGDTTLGVVLDAILGVELDAADGFVLVEGAGDTILGVVLGVILGAAVGTLLGVAVGAGVFVVEKPVKTMDISASSFEIELTVIVRVSPVFPLKSSNVKEPPASSSASRKDTFESLVVSFLVINTWSLPPCVCEFMPLAAL
jgi:hypothetical protein